MTKQELIEKLQYWPDDTIIELSIPRTTPERVERERTWFEIMDVETPQIIDKTHCLLYAGEITTY